MVDVFAVADLLVSDAVARCGDEIDIIGYYGSYARGDQREDSDLDLFYTPAEGADPPISRTFLLDGRLFDFWAIRWETLEGFATGRLRAWAVAPALVEQVRVLYARTPDQRARLEGLKEKIRELKGPRAREAMVNRSLRAFRTVTAHLGLLRMAAGSDSLADCRHSAWHLATSVCECLALANQAYFPAGFGKGMRELAKLGERPDEMETLIATIAVSPEPGELLAAGERLASATREVLRRFQQSIDVAVDTPATFRGAYPELKEMISRLVSACTRDDRVGASFEAWRVQDELTMMLSGAANGGSGMFNHYSEHAKVYEELGFPDLMSRASGPLAELSTEAERLDARLRDWLRDQSVDLCEYDTIADLRQAL